MLRRLFSALVVPAVALAPLALWAQDSSPAAAALTAPEPVTSASTAGAAAAPALSLEEAVARALDQNFTLSLRRIDRRSVDETVKIADAAFDPSINVTASHSYNQSATAGTTIDGTESESTQLRAGASQDFVTGTTVGVNTALARDENNRPVTTSFNPAFDADVSLSVRQSLLRGFGTGYNRASLERARLSVRRSTEDFRSDVLTVVRSVEGSYYNLVFAREQLGVREFSLSVSEQLLEENRARRETGVATDLEVLQAEVGVANARRALLLAQQDVRDSEDALLQLIGRFEFDDAPGAVAFPTFTFAVVDFEESIRLARTSQPALISSDLAIKQLELDARVAASNRLPILDVGGALGLNSKEGSASRAGREVWSGDGHSWQVDVQFSMPLGLRAENARLRQARFAVEREQTRLQQLEQDILVQVRSAVRAVEVNLESVRISALATELSRKQFELEKARYDNGLSTFRRVQETQEDLDTARVNELSAQVTLRLAYADLARLEGSSIPRYRIELEQ